MEETLSQGAKVEMQEGKEAEHRNHTCLATLPSDNAERAHWFDNDGIVFIIDNSATVIMCNNRSIFPGELKLDRDSLRRWSLKVH